MPALSFSKIKFPNLILTGRKPFTIRNDTKRNRKLFRYGALINFYYRQRAPISSKPIDIGGHPVHGFLKGIKCLGCFEMQITDSWVYFDRAQSGGNIQDLYRVLSSRGLGRYNHGEKSLDAFSQMDGFENWEEMVNFFQLEKKIHDRLLILWEPVNREPIMQRCNKCGKVDEIHLLEQQGNIYFHAGCGGKNG